MKIKEYNDICRNEIYKNGKFLMNKILTNTEKEKRKLNVNCDEFGMIRIFQRNKFNDWNADPIPMDIISSKMKTKKLDKIPVQMFEVAKCNLHCWWCYLPKQLRNITEEYTKWFSVSELFNLFERENNDVKVIYLSGGNPELVPEFVYSFMKELDKRKRSQEIFLWSDDVLTTDFLIEKMSKEQINYMTKYKNYAKICCLKGFDNESFEYNTGMDKKEFDNQIKRLKICIDIGFDVYGYIILVCKDLNDIESKIKKTMDKLQEISYFLPLRIIPIKIEKFSAVIERLNEEREQSILNQYQVLQIWNNELYNRFTKTELECNIADLKLK